MTSYVNSVIDEIKLLQKAPPGPKPSHFGPDVDWNEEKRRWTLPDVKGSTSSSPRAGKSKKVTNRTPPTKNRHEVAEETRIKNALNQGSSLASGRKGVSKKSKATGKSLGTLIDFSKWKIEVKNGGGSSIQVNETMEGVRRMMSNLKTLYQPKMQDLINEFPPTTYDREGWETFIKSKNLDRIYAGLRLR